MKKLRNGVQRTCTVDATAWRNAKSLSHFCDNFCRSKTILQDTAALNHSAQERFLEHMAIYVRKRLIPSDINDEYYYGIFMNCCALLYLVYPQKYTLCEDWDNRVQELGLECTKSFLQDLIIKNQAVNSKG